MQAAHDALELMRARGVEVGLIDVFQDTPEAGNQRIDRRGVTVGQRGIVVSASLDLDQPARTRLPHRPWMSRPSPARAEPTAMMTAVQCQEDLPTV